MAYFGVRKVTDAAGDIVIHDQRKIGVCHFQICLRPRQQVRIHRERNIVRHPDRRLILLAESVALLQGIEFERVDGVDPLLKCIVQYAVAFQIATAGQKNIDRAIKIFARRLVLACLVE